MSQADNKYTSGRAKKSRRGPKQTEAENRNELLAGLKTDFKSGSHANDPVVNGRQAKARMGEKNPTGDTR